MLTVERSTSNLTVLDKIRENLNSQIRILLPNCKRKTLEYDLQKDVLGITNLAIYLATLETICACIKIHLASCTVFPDKALDSMKTK